MITVTSQEITSRLAHEIGILTVNNFMQSIQIEKMEVQMATDAATIERLNLLVSDFRAQIDAFAGKQPLPKRRIPRGLR